MKFDEIERIALEHIINQVYLMILSQILLIYKEKALNRRGKVPDLCQFILSI